MGAAAGAVALRADQTSVQLTDMSARVSQRLAEAASPVFYPGAEIIAAINEGLRFFTLLTLALERTATWTVPPFSVNGSVPYFHLLQYFPDFIVPLRIATSTGAKVRPASLTDLDSLDSQWWNSPGNPMRYASLGVDLVALYQQFPVGGTLQVTYARGPVPLVQPGDVPEIPEQFHPRLIDYAIYRCRMVEGSNEFGKALPYFNSFLDGAQVYGDFVRERSKAQKYDRMPYELSRFDRKKLMKMGG